MTIQGKDISFESKYGETKMKIHEENTLKNVLGACYTNDFWVSFTD